MQVYLHAGQAAGVTGIPLSRFAALPGHVSLLPVSFPSLAFASRFARTPRLLGLLPQGSRDLPLASRFARHPRALPLPGVAHWPLAVPTRAPPWPRQACLANVVLDRSRDSRPATLGTLARGAPADSLRRRRSAADRRPERQAKTIAGICNTDASCAQRPRPSPDTSIPAGPDTTHLSPSPATSSRGRSGRWVISDEQPRAISAERRSRVGGTGRARCLGCRRRARRGQAGVDASNAAIASAPLQLIATSRSPRVASFRPGCHVARPCGGMRHEPGDRSAVQDVVEPEPEHPQPDVVVGQVHQLAAGADPGQHEVTVGRPLLRAEVEL